MGFVHADVAFDAVVITNMRNGTKILMDKYNPNEIFCKKHDYYFIAGFLANLEIRENL